MCTRSFVHIFIVWPQKRIPLKWNTGHANRNRHTESSWHFNYNSFYYRARVRCAFRMNTKQTHADTHTRSLEHVGKGKLWNKTFLLSTAMKWNGMLRFVDGTLWFKSDHEVCIPESGMDRERRGNGAGKFFSKPLISTCSNLCGEWTCSKSMH